MITANAQGPSSSERRRGLLYGLLVGDALGAWSDDGAQALGLLWAALESPGEVHEHFAGALLDWYHRGAWTPDGKVFDIGNTTVRAIQNLDAGSSARSSGPDHERSLGNGSLMRVAPLALVLEGDALRAAAELQSRVTHGHPVARVACAVYATWCRELLGGAEPGDGWNRAWDATAAWARREDSGDGERAAALARIGDELGSSEVRGTGYVLHSLGAARHLLSSRTSYESIVRGAIALGDDTDTTAAIAGAAAGARWGEATLPPRWVEALRGRATVEQLLARAS